MVGRGSIPYTLFSLFSLPLPSLFPLRNQALPPCDPVFLTQRPPPPPPPLLRRSPAPPPSRPCHAAYLVGGEGRGKGLRGRRAVRHTAFRGGGRAPACREPTVAGESTVRRGHVAIRGGSRGSAAGLRAARPAPQPARAAWHSSVVCGGRGFGVGLCFLPPPVAGRRLGPDPAAPSLDPTASLPDLVGALLSRLASRSPEPSSLPSVEPSVLKP
ncbi:hypothetical protein PVAP13_4KG281215 [Panicum virgatum]|uniref:Uncharacterized protein n=1 Tax=Panicum virgatum TaxID=38727 RepID=A0A8T0TKJ5_PANVG|nr:hypothetical protein PVAP13_4KG281215 [Panicum virgatum]